MPLLLFLLALHLPTQTAPAQTAPGRPGKPVAAPTPTLRATPTATAPPPAKVVAEPIMWSASRPLIAADFKARPSYMPAAALTVADLKATAACKDYVFAGGVKATFDPNTSWIKDPKTLTPALLRHEQLHFDIAELNARRIRQKISLTKFDCLKLQPAFDNLTKPAYRVWGAEGNRYDAETNHGLNAAKQALWEQQIAAKLLELKAFE